MPSSVWTSLMEPRVHTDMTCVWPRVKTAEPWARGSSPTSHQMGRTWVSSRPSGRMPLSMILRRMTSLFSA